MPRKNRDGKWMTFMVAASTVDGKVEMREVDPDDPALAVDPKLLGHGVGRLRVENDDQVWVVIATDDAAYVHATQALGDAQALAQEHGIPHRPYKPDGNS